MNIPNNYVFTFLFKKHSDTSQLEEKEFLLKLRNSRKSNFFNFQKKSFRRNIIIIMNIDLRNIFTN